MRFGDINPEEVQNVSVSKHPATRELSNVFHRKIDEVVKIYRTRRKKTG
jgi:hypothetical protein